MWPVNCLGAILFYWTFEYNNECHGLAGYRGGSASSQEELLVQCRFQLEHIHWCSEVEGELAQSLGGLLRKCDACTGKKACWNERG